MDNGDHSVKSLAGWLNYVDTVSSKPVDLGLERVSEVYKRLCLLHHRSMQQHPALVITFAGTNGKGSTLSMVEALALNSGNSVGAYTSPHLLRFNERIRVNGQDVSDEVLIAGFGAIEQVRCGESLTYFEYATLVALEVFLQANLDMWLLEVGLGGRLDAVNIIDPNIAVITTIDLDHQEWLGPDRETIGAEKAGIIRAGIPLVLGSDDIPASVFSKATELSADVFELNRDFAIDHLRFTSRRSSNKPLVNNAEITLQLTDKPVLPADNLATALQVARLAELDLQRLERQTFPTVAVKGRFQTVNQQPFIVLDVAHNPHAARYLSKWLIEHPVAGPDVAVFSALGDKDVRGVVKALSKQFQHWHLFEIDSPRAMKLETLTATVKSCLSRETASAQAHDSAQQALQHASRPAGKHGRILVFGSFLTVAAIAETGMIGPL